VQGAIRRNQSGITAAGLAEDIRRLLQPEQQQKMRDSIRNYKTQSKRNDLCSIVKHVVNNK
jgi:UDP-N-acetylglucosamine:LPS N-acetylglucosamine transferase